MKTENKIDIRGKSYFPFGFIALGVAFIFISALNVDTNPILAAVFFLISLVAITTHNRLQIDLNNKWYREYVWLLGMKIGETVPYEQMEYFYITTSTKGKTHGQINRVHISKEYYNVYLKFSEEDKLLVYDSSSKLSVSRHIDKINKHLGLDIVDYSEQN